MPGETPKGTWWDAFLVNPGFWSLVPPWGWLRPPTAVLKPVFCTKRKSSTTVVVPRNEGRRERCLQGLYRTASSRALNLNACAMPWGGGTYVIFSIRGSKAVSPFPARSNFTFHLHPRRGLRGVVPGLPRTWPSSLSLAVLLLLGRSGAPAAFQSLSPWD